jgi:putative ABC transport system permease protein
MLQNYFKIALRNIQRNAVYSFINIFGLSVGITCTILILVWIQDEVSYNHFLPNIDRIHQVWMNGTYDGQVNSQNAVPLPTAEGLRQTDSRIRHAVTADWGSENLLSVGETRFKKRGLYATDEFLLMFQFPMIAGSREKALAEPNSIVITEDLAKAFFGETDPMNQLIRIDNADDLKVTGLLKNVPSNSSFQFDYIISFRYYEKQEWVKNSVDNWGNNSFQAFVQLQPGTLETDVEAKIKDLLTKKGQTDIKREFFLHPMERWRLHSTFKDGKESGGMIEYVNMFALIAVFILIIACINFMNLATARSERRAREVGIRKSVGSRRKELIFQFLGESILISFFAFIGALLMTELSLPLYNNLIEKQLSLDYTSSGFWIFGIGITLITGLLAGSYPAFYLSSFNVVRVLKGKIVVGKSAMAPRKVLVVLQFVFSIVLIVCSIVIHQQIQHVKNRDLGYSQENLITIGNTADIDKNYHVIKNELLASGAAVSVTKSNSPITDIYSNNFVGWPGKPEEQKVMFTTIATEYDYTKTMGVKVIEGRDFSEDFKSDTAAVMINKAALDVMGLKDPIGAKLDLWGQKRELVGITENVLMGSLFREVTPAVVVFMPSWVNAVTIRLPQSDDLPATLKKVESIFKKYNPAYPFEYAFADEEFQKKFKTINMMSGLGSVFTFIAICITGLGLFGLAAFTAEQRTKEVGIRKVLGASVPNLVFLISREFTVLVVLAFIFSAPLAYWGSDLILERYPYRINFPLWVLPVSGFISLVFALFIVCTQAFKAATSNPVHSLRNE